MARKVSVKKYVIAFVLTLIIFTAGVFAGMALDDARLNDSKQINQDEKLNLRSLQLQESYIDSGLADCNALNQVLETNINELAKKMAIIIDYEKNSIFNQNEFNAQLRDYFLTEIQFLLVAQQIDNKCQKDSIKVIYFYDDDINDTQGKILDYLKKKFKHKVLVFSFNSAFQEPMISILLESYNIKQYPAVVVGEKVYQGHTNVKTLMSSMCDEFEESKIELPKECEVLKS